MTKLEALAVELHNHMWTNMGVTADWPLQVCGDDGAIMEFVRLMNELQDEIMANGYNRIQYKPAGYDWEP